MKAQHALGLDLSRIRVTVVFLIDIAILVLAGRWPGDAQTARYVWWSGVGLAVLVAFFALVTYRRVPLTTVLVASVLGQFADPKTILTEGRTPAVDHHRRYGREKVGMREHQGRLVTAIAVGGRPVVTSGRHAVGTQLPVALPVDSLAAALRQFDVRLDSIDIVSVALDPAGQRSTWVMLRMDPQRNVFAVAARDSLAATLAAATERLAHDLDGRYVSAHMVTAEEFRAIDATVLAGLQPTQVRGSLGRLKRKNRTGYVTSFWVSPRDITTENLEELWLSEVDATVVTVRLTPVHGRTDVSVLVRYHSGDRLDRSVRSSLNRLIGRRQLTAICASLPVPERYPGLMVPGRPLHDGEPLTVALDPVDERLPVHAGAQP